MSQFRRGRRASLLRAGAAASLVLVGAVSAGSRAHAQRVDSSIARPSVLPPRPIGGVSIASPRRTVPVLVELRPEASRLSPEPFLELDALPDVELVRHHGELALVRVGVVGVSSLAGSRLVLRAMDARTPYATPPLDRSRQLLSLDAAWGRATVERTPRDRFTGEGVTIADVDSTVDPFHPAFFRGDAGWYTWLDVNGDGRVTPGIDAIDLDRDGVASEGETLEVLRASPIDLGTGEGASGVRRATFDPGYDWLYLDEDGDGERDTALTLDGVSDDTAGFGEPIFTPDDLDRDGVLGPHERVVRLGTSKIARLLVDLIGPSTPYRREFVRGVDLHAARRNYTGGLYGYADTLHGSGVVGILAGDLPLVGRRWVGIAPDAEILDAFFWGDSQTEPLMWALENGADVVLHEYVSWTRVALDGGDPLGTLIDRSSEEGIAHVCPAGNIGGSRKHARIEARASTPSTITITVPGDVAYWESSIHGPTGVFERVTLRVPTGEEIELERGTMVPLPIGDAYVQLDTTLRDRDFFTFVVASADGSPIAAGDHTLTIDTTTDATLDAFLSDTSSGFGFGVAFPEDRASDASTISWPATSDLCTAVGAVPAYLESEAGWARGGPERAGEVRAYSSRGPRIDGDLRVHVVAPDNPWSVLGAEEIYPMYPGDYLAPEGAFQIFGGTSGAGPHVAGLAALLVESGVRGTAVRERLMGTAIDDGFTALPDPSYGAGRIDALRAMANGTTEDGGGAPTVSLVAIPAQIDLGGTVRLVATASDPEDEPVTLRWDEQYDGTWDGEYVSDTERTITPALEGAASEGWAFAKVRARDGHGLVAEASVRIRVGAYPEGADAGTPDAGVGDAGPSSGGGGGCGCRASGTTGPTGSVLVLGLVVALTRRRRRCR